MKPRNVNVALYQEGGEEVRVWCVSFNLKGSIRKNGKPDEAARRRMQSLIQKFLEGVDFPDLNGENK